MKIGKMIDTIIKKPYLRGIREDKVVVKWREDGSICYDICLVINTNGDIMINNSQVPLLKDIVNGKWEIIDISGFSLLEEHKCTKCGNQISTNGVNYWCNTCKKIILT